MQLKSLLLLFVVSATLVHCGAAPLPTSEANSDDATPDSASALALKHQELFRSHAELSSRTQADAAEVSFLTSLNQKLCERLDTLRKTCLPSYRIINEAQEKSLSCSTTVAAAPVFSVSLDGTSVAAESNFALTANNLFESNSFQKGSTNVSFYSNFNSGSLIAPRFVDLSQFKLKALTGQLPKLGSGFKFSFSIANTVLFNESHLLPSDDGQSYLISLNSMATMRRSNKCVASYQELDELTNNIKRDTKSSPSISAALASKHFVDKNMPATAGEWKNLVTDLQGKVSGLQQELEDESLQLDFERDRQGKLTKELLGESALGCFAHQHIHKIELQVKGVHLEDGAMFETSDKQPTVGQPASIQFQFGEQLSFNNSDEERSSVFREDGQLVFEEKGQRKIGEIEYIRVEKGGIEFKNAQTCSQFLLFFKVCRQQNWETKRYRMDDLAVLINDQLFYKKTGINAVLEKSSLRWEDKNLGMNPTYLQLMARDDCPTVQE